MLRLRELRQCRGVGGGDPSHERLPDRNEEAQSTVEEAQEREQTLLAFANNRQRNNLIITI